MDSERPIDRILDRLDGVTTRNGHFEALCPAHDDHRPSLDIKEIGDNGSHKVLIKCRAGCDTAKVLAKVGLEWRDLFSNDDPKNDGRIVAVYDYKLPGGEVLHQTVRFEPKRFLQRRPVGNGGYVWSLEGIQPVLYQLPDVMRALLSGEPIFVCEGEKDCDRTREELGIIATTCPMGAGRWRDSYTTTLQGAVVVFVPDNDEAGRRHALKVAKELEGVARSVKVLELPELPEKGDLSDWLDAGGTREEFDALVSETPGFLLHHIGGEFDEEKDSLSQSADEFAAEAGEKPDWRIHGQLAKGSITSVSGLAKYSGKTTLVTHMVDCLINGKAFIGRLTERSNVVYLTEQGNNFVEALKKSGLINAPADSFRIIPYKRTIDMPWPDLISRAVKECKRYGAGVLVVDTFAEFAEIRGTEENNSGDVSEKMEPLKRAARVHDLAVLFTRHAGKDGRGRGSSQFEADVDIIIELKRPEGNCKETERILESIGRYDASVYKTTIELTDEGFVARGYETALAFADAKRSINAVLPDTKEYALKRTQIWEKVQGEGFSESTLDRALEELRQSGEISRAKGEGKGAPWVYWASKNTRGDDRYFPHQTSPIDDEEKREGGAGAHELVTDPESLAKVAVSLDSLTEVSIDLETTGLSPIEDRVRLISVHAAGETFLIDAFAVDPSPLFRILKDKVLYVHGAEFDLPFLYHHYGFEPPEDVIDTLHLSQVARAGEWQEKEDGRWERKRHSLKDALERELGVTLGGKAKYQRGDAWVGDLTEEHLEYAAGDVVHLKALANKLLALIEERGLTEVWELERRAKPLFLEMCIRGIPLDKGRWERLIRELEDRVVFLKEKAGELAPPHPEGLQWNWNSPKQAKEAFSLVGVEVSDLQRDTLYKYKHPLVEAVAEYRNAQSLLSRVRVWATGRYQEGRIYPQWNPAGAATGRASCTTPNVQSLPKGGGFRGCVSPGDGRVLIKADLSQIELRVLAAITEDENMFEVFRDGEDIHLNTAEALAGQQVEKEDPERQKAKAVNFGLSFGMGAKKFRDMAERDYGIRMSLSEAKEAKRKLLDAYPGIRRWHLKEAAERDRGNFETFTLLGRRRVVEPDYEGKPSFTERLNAPVQGTAADILKLALARLWESLEDHPGALPILTVHDEVVIECDAEVAQDTARWLGDTLRGAVADVPGYPELAREDVAEISVLTSWGEV